MKTKLVSVLREFEIPEHPSPGNETFVFDSYTYTQEFGLTHFWREITQTRTPWNDSLIRMDDGRIIGSGEDPRAFVWRGSPCALVTTFSPGHGPVHRVYVHKLEQWFTLIPPKRIKSGKNWMPYVQEDALYIIHGISPFRVLKTRFLSENDGFMVLDIAAEHRLPTRKSSDGFSQFRGGSNGLQIGDRILGLGHTNQQRARKVPTSMQHRPFVLDYTPGKSVSLHSLDFDFPGTYRIVDPTSLFWRDGDLFLVTSETERVWHKPPQKGRICLYSLNIDGAEHEESFGLGRRRLHRWSYGEPTKIRRLLGSRR